MKRSLKILILILACAVAFNLTACDKEKKYKALSTIFDGVPKPWPDTTGSEKRNIPENRNTKKDSIDRSKFTLYMHKPYEERACESCHEQKGSFRLSAALPDLCYKCHMDYHQKLLVVHGPLEAGECLNCHNPHQSEHKKLLTRKGQEICLFCHKVEDIQITKLHQDIGDRLCWECHNPHGGSDRTFMKQ